TIDINALTVAVSLSALLIFPLYFLRSFAYAGIGVVLLAMLSSLVTLPALLAVVGHRVDTRRARHRAAVATADRHGLCERSVEERRCRARRGPRRHLPGRRHGGRGPADLHSLRTRRHGVARDRARCRAPVRCWRAPRRRHPRHPPGLRHARRRQRGPAPRYQSRPPEPPAVGLGHHRG